MTIKKLAYLTPLLVALLPLLGFSVGQASGQWALASCLTPLVLFIVVPLLDWIIGRDPSNPSEVESATLSERRYYRLLTMLCFPAYLCTLLFGAWVIANVPMSPLVMTAWIASIGLVGGIVAINPAHEMIHKSNAVERSVGGTLLAMVSYGTFKVEHIAGHHIDVATPKDLSTASMGQTVFGFILRSITKTPLEHSNLSGLPVSDAEYPGGGIPAKVWAGLQYRSYSAPFAVWSSRGRLCIRPGSVASIFWHSH